MKFKWRFWSWPTFAVVVVAWCVLSYVFMWPPVVRNVKWAGRPTSVANPWGNNLRIIDPPMSEWAKDNCAPVTLDQIKPYQWEGRPTSAAYSCINNLIQIDGAILEWAKENHKSVGDPVTFDQIKPFLKLNSKGGIPVCPQGGKYSVTVVGALPTCSLGTNSNLIRVRVHYFFWDWFQPHRLPLI